MNGRSDYLKLGDWNAICDVCGLKFKASEIRARWDGMMVCGTDFEERHPSDLFRIPRAERPLPWARPPQNQYVTGLAYQIADGTYSADGSIVADGGSAASAAPQYVVFGPVDPDSL